MLSTLCRFQITATRARETLRERLENNEEGASTIEWVIITGLLIALVGLVGKVIYSYVTEQANKIKVGP